jgi:hypothetical protein
MVHSRFSVKFPFSHGAFSCPIEVHEHGLFQKTFAYLLRSRNLRSLGRGGRQTPGIRIGGTRHRRFMYKIPTASPARMHRSFGFKSGKSCVDLTSHPDDQVEAAVCCPAPFGVQARNLSARRRISASSCSLPANPAALSNALHASAARPSRSNRSPCTACSKP